jgi:hypothetical protein
MNRAQCPKITILACFHTHFLTQRSPYLRLALKALLCIGFAIMLLGFNAYEASAQNTKGDRPEVRSGGKRENRFKPLRKKNKTKSSYNRVKSRRFSPANSARVARPTKANKNVYNRRTFVNNRSTSAKVSRQNTRSGGGGRITPRSTYGRSRNVYPQRGRFVNNQSTAQFRSSRNKIVSNRSQVARAKRFGTKQNPPSGRGIASPRTASRPFIARKSTTPFAGFWNRKPKGEKPYTKGDLVGRPLRTKNFQTRKPILTNPTAHPYRVKPTRSDRPYRGPIRGGYVSGSRSGQPWKGDIAGRKIKGRNYSSKRPPLGGKRILPPPRSASRGGRPYKGTLPGSGYRSISGRINNGGGAQPVRSLGKGSWNNKGRSIPARNAGANGTLGRYSGNIKGRKGYSLQGEGYTGSIKARKRVKGGGSISGAWNNNGRAIAGRNAGANGNLGRYSGNIKGGRRSYSPQGESYTGNIKARKQVKGGGSISGAWNNNGRAVAGRYPGGDASVSRYQGNVKFQRRQKGGGSVSGTWNNNGRAVAGRYGGGDPKVSRYQGNVKFQGRPKGGGSISGAWNNNGRAIAGRYPGGNPKISNHRGYKMFELKPSMRNQGEEFTGTIKAKPKPKGAGGSVSGKFWNNNQQSTSVKNPNSTRMARFQGNTKVKKDTKKDIDYFPGKLRQFDLHPSMRDQGEEFTGNIKLSRFKKNYVKNPNAAKDALKKDRPDKTTYLVNGLQIKVKQKDYKKRPHGAEGSMPGIAPGKNSVRASEYTRVIRQRWDYKRNPSSSSDALRVREPGKAFLRATDYQGNIKVKRFDLFSKKKLYPDSRFVKTNKNNTDEERGLLTNFKLWWARLFKKNENQPDHLKEKVKKPRYDKGEQGLWYD